MGLFGKKGGGQATETELSPAHLKLVAVIKSMPFGVYQVVKMKIGEPEKAVLAFSNEAAEKNVEMLREMLTKALEVINNG